VSSMATAVSHPPQLDDHQVRAARLLDAASSNPVQSGEQSCAIAQVHALLAIEERLAQLCAAIQPVGR